MQDLADSSKPTPTRLVTPLCLDLSSSSCLLYTKVVNSSFVEVVKSGRSTLPMLSGLSKLACRPPHVPLHTPFIAFFGGVEHEITPVSSGYRVTLTYNLYRKSSAVPPNPVYTEFEAQLMEGLAQLLKGPSFLPKGGILGFGLDHKYPINPTSTDLRGIEKCLKGMDESIRRVCESLSLKTTIGAIMGMMISKTGSQMALMLEQVDMMSSWTISLTLGADYRFEVTPK